jgi:hypothetical protein
MSRSGRKVVYTEERVRAMFARMRGELQAQHFRHLCAMSDLHRELAQTRAEFEQLKATVRTRQNAEAECRRLYRERDIARAQAAERNPVTPLQ